MMRIGWWLVNGLSRLLDGSEREIVRGDIEECHTPIGRAFREVLGLVLRRQVALWYDWRPWFIVAAVVIPLGLMLSHATRSWGILTGRDIDIYWRFWDFSYLAVPGWRRDVIDIVVRTVSGCLALIGWSWTCGFVMSRFSRRTAWMTALMFVFVVFSGTLGSVISRPLQEFSLQYHVIQVVLPRFFRTFLVVLPVVWGAYRGSKASSLPLAATVFSVAVLAGATFLASASLERSVTFGRGVVPPDPGPDGFFISADDPRPLWFLSLLMIWPAAHILVDTIRDAAAGRKPRAESLKPRA